MDLLHYAAHGELSEVKQLIEKGTCVNLVNSNGQTALFFACENGHYGVTRFLLENRALVNYRAKPLIAAARNGHADCVELLLKHGADALCTNRNGETAMSVAVRKMNVSVILLLIDHGVRPHIPLKYLLTKMFSSANAEDGKLFHKMLKNGTLSIKSDKSLVAAFQFAFKHGCLEMASYLLSLRLSSDMQQVYLMAVYCSVRNNWFDILTELLKKGVDVNVMMESCTPLFSACENGSEKAVHLLLQYGADPNFLCEKQRPTRGPRRETLSSYLQNNHYKTIRSDRPSTSGPGVKGNTTPLLVACEMGLLVIAKTLLSSGADPNLVAFDKQPLSVACQHGHHEIVKLLLENGADVQATDKNNKSALYHALESIFCRDSNTELFSVNLLLDYGADSNTITSSGKSSFYMACSRGLTTTVQRMLKCGAKVNGGKDESSPLNVACRNKHMAVVELLLNEGADPNVHKEIADQHSFALHIAAADHSDELVTLLLNHGANVNTVDASGNTALHFAMKHNCAYSLSATASTENRQKVVDTLLCAGADDDGKTSMYLAVEKGLEHVVDSMLTHGGNPNVCAGDQYMLCTACNRQNVKVVEMLLKAGANPNVISADSGSEMVIGCDLPLCVAVKKDSCKIATLLLNYGAKVNALNSENESAMYLVLRRMNGAYRFSTFGEPKDNTLYIASSMTVLLLEHGADVNPLTPFGLSLLYVLLHQYLYLAPILSGRRWVRKTQIVADLVRMFICNGANLDDLSNVSTGNYVLASEFDVKILERLCAWCSADQLSVEFLKSGAGFKLSCSCSYVAIGYEKYHRAKSIHLCQAAIMAGYVPSTDELEEMRQSVSDERRVTPEYVELLTWLNEDRQQAPSLMRQCRVVIRQQLSIASCHRTILPAIDQLPLPSCLQQYLMFEGGLTEVDLKDNQVDWVTDEELSTSSGSYHDTSDLDENEWSVRDNDFASEHASDDDMVIQTNYESSD